MKKAGRAQAENNAVGLRSPVTRAPPFVLFETMTVLVPVMIL